MKRFLIISTSFLALLLILTGCSKSSQTANKPGEQNNQSSRMRQLDFGQPDRQSDIRGVVKSIVGSEVTILKIDMPAGGRNASSTPEQKNADANDSDTRNAVSFVGGVGEMGRGAGRVMIQGGPGGPDGPGGFGGQTDTARAQMLAKLKEMSTGEEKIIIPVGIRMLKMDTSNNKREMVEATLADITADKNITVWLSAVDIAVTSTVNNMTASTTASTTVGVAAPAVRKIAEFVLIN